MKKTYLALPLTLLASVFFGGACSGGGADAGSILFCQGVKTEDCYFKIGEEGKFKDKIKTNFTGKQGTNIYARAYPDPAGELGTTEVRISVYRNGTFWKGRILNDYKAEWKSAFINLTNAVYWDGKPFPPGNYKVQVSRKVTENKVVVFAESTFSMN